MKYDSVACLILTTLTKFPLWALILLVWIIMGSVCSAGNEERSKNVEVGKRSVADKLNKLKSFENGKVDCYSNSRTNHALHKLQKKPNSGKQVLHFHSAHSFVCIDLVVTVKNQMSPVSVA